MKKIILLVVSIVFLSTTPALAKFETIWLVGDAAAADCASDSTSAYGWGTALQQHLSKYATLVNLSCATMSAQTFEDQDLTYKMKELNKGSFIFLQFGTNDLKEYDVNQYSSTKELASTINYIITTARKQRINIVLITPLAQPYYKNGVLIDRLGYYPELIRHIAAHNLLPIIDLEKTTRDWLLNMTEEEAAQYFVTLDPTQLENGEYLLNKKGAKIVAEMAKDAILVSNNKNLKKIIK